MIRRILMIATAALLLHMPLHAQDEPPDKTDTGDAPAFIVEALTFSSREPGKTRIDVFLQVDLEGLSFEKDGDSYQASYDVTASLFDSANTLVSEQSWTDNITGLTYEQTIAGGAAKISQRSFTVAPGTYSLSILVRDTDTKKDRKIQRTFLVPSYTNGGICLSSIMLISRYVEQGGIKHIVPSVSSNMGLIPDAFHIFFEVYNQGVSASVRFTASVLDHEDRQVMHVDTVALIDVGRTEMFMKIVDTMLVVGDYKLMVVASTPSQSSVLAQVARTFTMRWRGMPMSVSSLDLAIEQVKYIARDAEYDSLKEAKTTEDKRRVFLAFWKKRDPNPNTLRNERMEEYYTRVDFANKHFSHFRPGWKTDMGMVYIILGPPSNIERHPFDMESKPYEVWSYYNNNLTFLFVDETGFGDYRLITPLADVYRYSQWK